MILPGRCRGDLAALSRDFGVPFELGSGVAAAVEHFHATRETGLERIAA